MALFIQPLAVAAPGNGKGGGQNKDSTTCRGKKCTSSDTTAPTIRIDSPTSGAVVSGTSQVTGSASDDVGVDRVEVALDGGGWIDTGETSAWSIAVDTAAYADGNHTISARATDASGNSATLSITVTFSNAEPDPSPTSEPSPSPSPSPSPTSDPDGATTTSFSVTDQSLVNPSISGDLAPLGHGRMAVRGDLSLLLYETRFGHEPWLYVRDASSGGEAHLRMPYDSLLGWTDASYALTVSNDLWIFSGSGPMYMRRYRLSGSPLPTSVSYVSTTTFGDSESRPGNMIQLASGGLVAAWHRQNTTAQHGVAYLGPSSSSWQTMTFAFLPTRASKDILVQHPADGSVWLFNNPDAWSSIGAAHFTETSSGLRLDWADAYFIDYRYGDFDADPENPDIAAAPDHSTGEIVLAYQSAKRAIFNSSVAGSYPAIARIRTDGAMSFQHLPIYVERISRLGLVVMPEQVWLLHRPIDMSDFTFDDLHVSRYAGGSWSTKRLGTLFYNYERVGYSTGRVEFSARLSDGRIHLFRG